MFVSLVVLAAVWSTGNLLVDPSFKDNDQTVKTELHSGTAVALRETFNNLPAEGGAETLIDLLDANSGAWAARWRLLAGARHNLEISYFVLDSDIFGISFLGHLLKKAREGTRVRIMLDAIGTTLSREIRGNDYLDALAGSGNVEVKMYRPYLFRFRDAFLTLNPVALFVSEHDKILIADDGRALIGGRNIAREYLAEPEDFPRAFRDADLLLSGVQAVAVLRNVFNAGFKSAKAHDVKSEIVDLKDSGTELLLAYEAMDAWIRGVSIPEKTAAAIRGRNLSWLDDLKKLPRLRGALKKEPPQGMTADLRFLDSRPRLLQSGDPVSSGLILLARSAKQDIFIQTPYLILSRAAVSILERAAARGVRITILTNSPISSDNALSQALFLEQWPEVMARVRTLRLFVAGGMRNIHGKIGVIDEQVALVGTYNMEPFSMTCSSELMAAVWSARFSRLLLEQPKRLLAEGPPLVFEYRIALDARGRPKRNEQGKVIVAFGREDHGTAEESVKVQWYRRLVRAAKKVPWTSELFWE